MKLFLEISVTQHNFASTTNTTLQSVHIGFLHTPLTPCKLHDLNFHAMLANMRHLLYALSLWIALAPGTQSTQNNDAGQTDSIAPLRLADIQQCPAAPKPSCDDPNCQGSRFVCATQFLCSSENPFTDPSTPSSGRQVILAGCRCCPLPIHIECTDCYCAPPTPASRVCAAEPLRGCTCQTHDDRFRAAQERAAGWVWPADMFDPAYDVDIEPDSGDEDEAQAQAQPAVSSSSNSTATAARGVVQWAITSIAPTPFCTKTHYI